MCDVHRMRRQVRIVCALAAAQPTLLWSSLAGGQVVQLFHKYLLSQHELHETLPCLGSGQRATLLLPRGRTVPRRCHHHGFSGVKRTQATYRKKNEHWTTLHPRTEHRNPAPLVADIFWKFSPTSTAGLSRWTGIVTDPSHAMRQQSLTLLESQAKIVPRVSCEHRSRASDLRPTCALFEH